MKQCHQLHPHAPHIKRRTGRCENKPVWRVTMRGITTCNIELCTPCFDNFRRAMQGTNYQWSSTPINRKEPPCPTHSESPSA